MPLPPPPRYSARIVRSSWSFPPPSSYRSELQIRPAARRSQSRCAAVEQMHRPPILCALQHVGCIRPTTILEYVIHCFIRTRAEDAETRRRAEPNVANPKKEEKSEPRYTRTYIARARRGVGWGVSLTTCMFVTPRESDDGVSLPSREEVGKRVVALRLQRRYEESAEEGYECKRTKGAERSGHGDREARNRETPGTGETVMRDNGFLYEILVADERVCMFGLAVGRRDVSIAFA
jgi:hypothetical protein